MAVTHISEAKNWKGTRVSRWAVIQPEVWGDGEGGWEVNDVRQIGKIELSNADDDDAVINDLITAQYLTEEARGNVDIDGDEDMVYINSRENFRPLLHVQRLYD